MSSSQLQRVCYDCAEILDEIELNKDEKIQPIPMTANLNELDGNGRNESDDWSLNVTAFRKGTK